MNTLDSMIGHRDERYANISAGPPLALTMWSTGCRPDCPVDYRAVCRLVYRPVASYSRQLVYPASGRRQSIPVRTADSRRPPWPARWAYSSEGETITTAFRTMASCSVMVRRGRSRTYPSRFAHHAGHLCAGPLLRLAVLMGRMTRAGHGGDVYGAARDLKRAPDRLLDFSASINPLGPAPAVSRVLKGATTLLRHYPDPLCWDLRQALAAYWCRSPMPFLSGMDRRN